MKKKLMVLAIVVLGAAGVGYWAVSSSAPEASEHLSISQVKSPALAGQETKVGGVVAPGSVIWDNESGTIRFVLTAEGDNLDVVYRGVAPNDFRPGTELLVQGTYSGQAFVARSMATRSSPLCRACHG